MSTKIQSCVQTAVGHVRSRNYKLAAEVILVIPKGGIRTEIVSHFLSKLVTHVPSKNRREMLELMHPLIVAEADAESMALILSEISFEQRETWVEDTIRWIRQSNDGFAW